MSIKLILSALFLVAVSCRKENNIEKKSATELLTQKEWMLAGYGYDSNNNNVIDPSEENIADCEKDNAYVFKTNGTGIHFDNLLSCANGITEQPFTWKLTNQETQLDFIFGVVKLLRLNEKELAISDESHDSTGQPTKFITYFKH